MAQYLAGQERMISQEQTAKEIMRIWLLEPRVMENLWILRRIIKGMGKLAVFPGQDPNMYGA